MTWVLRAGIVAGLLVGGCGGGGNTAVGRASTVGSEAADPAPPAEQAPSAGSSNPQAVALRDPVATKVTAEVQGVRSTYAGPGECTHTTDASIYEVPATMWSARVSAESGALRYLNLTLWQPKGAPDLQVSLGLMIGERSHDIATVKGASLQGSGTGRADGRGAGGSLQVDGKDANGASVRVTIECERWTEPIAEGG